MTPQEWLNYYDNEHSADDGREHLEIGEALEIIRGLLDEIDYLRGQLDVADSMAAPLEMA